MVLRAYADHRRRLVVFWSPKCGSRSLTRWFFLSCTDHPAEHANAPGPYLIGRYDVSYARAAQLVNGEGYFSVLSTRHPATRVLSAYLDKFVAPANRNYRRLDKAKPYVREVIEDVLAARRPRDALRTISFREFLNYLYRHLGRREQLNSHWSPQFMEAYFRRPVPFHHLLPVERFDEALLSLNDRLGIQTGPQHRNRSKRQAAAEPPVLGGLLDCPAAELVEVAVAYQAFLTPEVLAALAQYFEDDYRLLGYDPYAPESACALSCTAYQARRSYMSRALAPLRRLREEWGRWRNSPDPS